MADFFSRIFAQPSDDVSTSYSHEDNNIRRGGDDNGGTTHRRKKSSTNVHTRTLTPLSLSGGKNTSSFGAASDSHSMGRSHSSEEVEEYSAYDVDEVIDSTRHKARGRQRRNDASVSYRSTSEPRSPKRVHQRSASSSHQRTNSNTTNSNSRSTQHNMQLQLTQNRRRRRSASVQSPSHKQRSSSSSSVRRSKSQQRIDRSVGGANYHKENTNTAATPTKSKSKKKKFWKKKPNWSGTPPKDHGKKKSCSNQNNNRHHHSNDRKEPSSPGNRKQQQQQQKLSLPQNRNQPINVGDCITITQQFLEDNADMSVLTMPKDLMSLHTGMMEMEDEEGMVDDGEDEVIRRGNLVLQRESMKYATTTDHHSRRPRISAYASRMLEEGIQHNYVEDPPPPPPPPINGRSPISIQPSQQQSSAVAIMTAHHRRGASYDDPPGKIGKLIHGQQQQLRATSDPPAADEAQPFDEESECVGNTNNNRIQQQNHHRAASTSAVDTIKQQRSITTNNKAVSFALPPPPPPATAATTSNKKVPSPARPPFMGPQLDYYYSMERSNPKTKTTSNVWSNSLIVPPIIELWSSIESVSNIIPAADGGNNNGRAVCRWDIRKEDELLGEDISLRISEEWIDVRDKYVDMTEKEEEVEEEGKEPLIKATTPDDTTSTSKSNNWATSNEKEDHDDHPMDEPGDEKDYPMNETGDDEYLHNILDCGEDDSIGNIKEERGVDSSPSKHGNEIGAEIIPLKHGDTPMDETEDVNLRHRTTWTYKPDAPTNLPFDSPELLQNQSNDSWQILIHKRTNAAINIQKWIRCLLASEKLRTLLQSVLIIQPSMRRYLNRRRYLDYLKVKSSYYPRRWSMSNKSVDC